MSKIDLHFHSNYSDGFYSPQELLKLSENNDLKIISITGHNSVKAYYDIINLNLEFNGKILAGVELSFVKDGAIYDVLGYGIDLDIMNKWLEERFTKDKLKENQIIIFNEMYLLYKKLGIKFDENIDFSKSEVSAYNTIRQSALSFEENRVNFPELYDPMFFKRYHINRKTKFYVDETRIMPTIGEVVDIISKAGGISVLAHSGAYGFSVEEMKNFIEYAIGHGIQGLECKYNCHTKEQQNLIKDIAKKHGLFITGGSDFHGGKLKPTVKLGVVYNDENIFEADAKEFLSQIEFLNLAQTVIIGG